MIDECTFPGCRYGENNTPALTDAGMCHGCRNRLRRLIDDVVEDFATVKAYMPKPAARPQAVQQQGSGPKSFGHPAEWASVTATEIAQTLREQHGALAEDNRDSFPGNGSLHAHMRQVAHGRPPSRTADEVVIVQAAHAYLTEYFDLLCTFHGAADVAAELLDLHRRTRTALGHSRIRERLHAPCPHCDVAALVSFPGTPGASIECANCGHVLRGGRYPAYSHMMAITAAADIAADIDERIRAYDIRARIRTLCQRPPAGSLEAPAGPCSAWPAVP